MTDSDAQVERAREILRVLVGMSGLSRREVRRRLVVLQSGTDVARLLGGTLDIKLRHILDILEVIDVHPFEFFQMLFPPPQTPTRSRVMQLLEAAVAPGKKAAPVRLAPPLPEAGDPDDFRQRFAELMRELAHLMTTPPSAAPPE